MNLRLVDPKNANFEMAIVSGVNIARSQLKLRSSLFIDCDIEFEGENNEMVSCSFINCKITNYNGSITSNDYIDCTISYYNGDAYNSILFNCKLNKSRF